MAVWIGLGAAFAGLLLVTLPALRAASRKSQRAKDQDGGGYVAMDASGKSKNDYDGDAGDGGGDGGGGD